MKRSLSRFINGVDLGASQRQVSHNEVVAYFYSEMKWGRFFTVFRSGIDIDANLDEKEHAFGVFFVNRQVEEIAPESIVLLSSCWLFIQYS